MMVSPRTFTDLPNEIVLIIAEYLKASDLNALIQTRRRFVPLLTSHLYTLALTHKRKGLETVLEWATRKGQLPVIERLLAKGADLSRQNMYRRTVLHTAA